MPTKTTRETFREWLDRKHMTVDMFVHALPVMDGKPVVSTSTAHKWSSQKAHPESIHPATRLLVKTKFPDCPVA